MAQTVKIGKVRPCPKNRRYLNYCHFVKPRMLRPVIKRSKITFSSSFLEYLPFWLCLLEKFKKLQHPRRPDRLWWQWDQITDLLEYIFLQDLSWYEGWPTVKIYCHKPHGCLFALTYRWWALPRHFTGSRFMEVPPWVTKLIAAKLQ